MPLDIEWLDRAKADLRNLLDYISQDNPKAALDYVEDITVRVDQLGEFPESGKPYRKGFRVLIVRNHLIFYKHLPRQGAVLVIAVVDGRRDPRSFSKLIE